MSKARESHKIEVLNCLRREFPGQAWELSLPPHGTGHESYFARSGAGEYFVKLGVDPGRYREMARLGLSPRLRLAACLSDGTTLIVQEKIDGQLPSRQDFHRYLEQFASALRQVHHSPALKSLLPVSASSQYREAGREALAQVERRWAIFKPQVPACAGFVDQSLVGLRARIERFQGGGLVASHNDPCNGNWLVSPEGRVYLLDYESMSLDDPALDLGAFLWWYYPPGLRAGFLELAGESDHENLRQRMQVRMALHCLNILLPREDSFDEFQAETFEAALEDFSAVLAGQENPQGYGD